MIKLFMVLKVYLSSVISTDNRYTPKNMRNDRLKLSN